MENKINTFNSTFSNQIICLLYFLFNFPLFVLSKLERRFLPFPSFFKWIVSLIGSVFPAKLDWVKCICKENGWREEEVDCNLLSLLQCGKDKKLKYENFIEIFQIWKESTWLLWIKFISIQLCTYMKTKCLHKLRRKSYHLFTINLIKGYM